MKNQFIILLTFGVSLIGCSTGDVGVNGEKVLGKWFWSIKDRDLQVVNGALYEGKNKLKIIEELEIFRNVECEYTYRITNSAYWEKYNNIPKVEISTGRLDSQVSDSKWRFISGTYGDRGGYISVPENEWNTDTVHAIHVLFPKGRGREQLFTRKPIDLMD